MSTNRESSSSGIETLSDEEKRRKFEYEQETRRRLKLLQLCQSDTDFRKREYEQCRRSVKHFVNNWVDTYDPRFWPYNFPFRQYDFQNETLDWITDRYRAQENGLLEKSRDMGATWDVCAWTVHRYVFYRGFTARFGSRKEELVDDWTLDSIFGKLRFIIQRLPNFLLGFKPEMPFLRISNPASQNEILGESTNIGFGRGGRSSIVFLDEFAHVQHSEAVWASVKSNSKCIIPFSSVNGKGNQFSYLRHDTPIKVLRLHWSQHPYKDREWYEKEASEMQPWQVAQELDISYEKSKHGKIYQRFDEKYHVAKEIIEYKSEWEQFVSWDFGRAGAMALIWGQISPDAKTVELWNHLELSGWDIEFFTPISQGKKPTHYSLLDFSERKRVDFALKKIPENYSQNNGIHYGDHAGIAKTANSTRSCKDHIQKLGVEFKSTGRQGYDWRFECLDRLLRLEQYKEGHFRSRVQISPDLKRFIDCMNNATWDSENIHSDKINPKLDEFFHSVSAFEFLAINRFPTRKSSGITVETIR